MATKAKFTQKNFQLIKKSYYACDYHLNSKKKSKDNKIIYKIK